MARRRGNQNRYEPADDGKDEDLWRKAVQTSMFNNRGGNLYAAAVQEIEADTTRVEIVSDALAYLASITGDVVFTRAQSALTAYDLGKGGLKAAVKRLVSNSDITPEAGVMPMMHDLVKSGSSVRSAARQIAIEWGIPGQSFSSAVESLRSTYAAWTAGQITPMTVADTGRKLKVEAGPALKSTKEGPIDGISFDEHGFAIVPDDRRWRGLIDRGAVIYHGEIRPHNLV